jgi:small-conductance mechanosensitive channel
MRDLASILEYPLVRFSGGALTLSGILGAAAIIVISFFFARLAARGIGSLLRRRNLSSGVQFAGRKIVHYCVLVIGILVAINSLGLNLSAVFAASAVLLVGIGFGLQNIAQNFISGLIILIEQPIRQGDFIKAGDTYGTVDDIGLRATRVITRDQVTVIVPNSQLITAPVVNHSAPTSQLRVRVHLGVAYGSDISKVSQVLLRVARENPRILPEPPAEVRFDNFGSSSLEFSLLAWISNARDDLRITSELRFAIEAAFREAGIEIPFPQRDIHLRSGFQELLAATKGDTARGG